jgi:hypothetical protein
MSRGLPTSLHYLGLADTGVAGAFENKPWRRRSWQNEAVALLKSQMPNIEPQIPNQTLIQFVKKA